MEPNKVLQALKVLQDEGREDLVKDGVLEEPWVGLRRPKRLSSKGVTAAVLACTSPQRKFKKFKAKSVYGHKVTRSPETLLDVVAEVSGAAEVVGLRRRGGGHFSRRSGVSLARLMAAGGRGAGPLYAVSGSGRKGAQAGKEHVWPCSHVVHSEKQAQQPLEKGIELDKGYLEECSLGCASKMAASSGSINQRKGILEERPLSEAAKMAVPGSSIEDEVVVYLMRMYRSKEARLVLEIGKKLILVVFTGNRQTTVHRQFERLTGVQSLPVKVRAPSRHQVEGRVKSRAVYPTSRETYGSGSLGQGADSVFDVQPSTSRGAGASVEYLEEELLDYEDEVDEHVTPVLSGVVKEAPQAIPKVVRGVHFGSCRRDTVAGSLPRGEEGISVSWDLVVGGRILEIA
ncbi:hypothetical protein NDU88_002052 [Pleurodeles waltl]|uniref:Uncharacterized protein n=1 Tax=Pleurodeles waltl TaxID=8319 RepID=A0AAV7P782_PLEWA|nr:hypothetical protein NDU88_002052 [Pleurodeles waltl]